MKKQLFGVLGRTTNGYELYTHCSNVDLMNELRFFWQQGNEVHLKIESDTRKLLDESQSEIYYDKDKNGKYRLHINDINIEQVLNNSVGKKLDITIVTAGDFESEDVEYDTRYAVCNS